MKRGPVWLGCLSLSLVVSAAACGPDSRQAAPEAGGRPAAIAAPGATGSAVDSTPATAEFDSTSVAAAAEVVRDYYAAINARDYRTAYEAWSGAGAASGRTYEPFAAGFSNTARVEATIGVPGREDGAAGSRYVEVPVTLRAMTTAGAGQRFAGHYVLRRSVVDGATAAQRRWHFESAKLVELR